MSIAISFQPETLIRILTMLSLSGLLFAVGLRLELTAVADAVRGCRLALILPLNFLAVPLLATALALGFAMPPDLANGMLLLAAAPFAPVVPVFVKMARGDLALAAGLTAIFPVFSTFITPVVCQATLLGLANGPTLQFDPLGILAVLFATVTLPLLAGMLWRRAWPGQAARLLRPLEVLSETVGALSLAFITTIEFRTILAIEWKSLLAMALAGELSFFLGHALGGPRLAARRVIAVGTSNRNIALALLLAVDGFSGTKVAAAVVANGLLLIFLGLLHVAYYRFAARDDGAVLAPCRRRLKRSA